MIIDEIKQSCIAISKIAQLLHKKIKMASMTKLQIYEK